MSEYDELPATIEKIIDEAIKQDMAYRHFVPTGHGFEYVSTGDEPNLHIPDRHAGGIGVVELPENLFHPDDPKQIDVWGEVYGPWISDVHELFEPYLTMPRPEDFASAITHAFDATQRLSPGRDVNDVDIPANQALGDIDYARSLVEDMRGDSVRAFNRYCLSPLPLVAASQCGAAANITESLLAEQAIWIKSQESIVSVADSMLSAMAESGPQPSDDDGGLTAFLKVTGVVLATAAVFASGGWAVAVGLAGVGLGLLQEVIPTQDQPADLSGGTPWLVLGNAQGAADQLSTAIRSEEIDLKHRLMDQSDRLQDDGYQLRPEGGVIDATDQSDYTDGPNLLKVQAEDMREVGGDVLPNVGLQFLAAADALLLDDGNGAWSRDGNLGMSPAGPFEEYRGAADLLSRFAQDAGLYVDESGRMFVLAAGFIGRQDDVVKERLEHARGNVGYSRPLPSITSKQLEARLG